MEAEERLEGKTIPGKFILDSIIQKNLSQKEVATRMKISTTLLNLVIHGKRKITPDIAIRLEKVLGIKAETWMRLQNLFDINQLLENNNSIKKFLDDETS